LVNEIILYYDARSKRTSNQVTKYIYKTLRKEAAFGK